jgi:hypothetical protein
MKMSKWLAVLLLALICGHAVAAEETATDHKPVKVVA